MKYEGIIPYIHKYEYDIKNNHAFCIQCENAADYIGHRMYEQMFPSKLEQEAGNKGDGDKNNLVLYSLSRLGYIYNMEQNNSNGDKKMDFKKGLLEALKILHPRENVWRTPNDQEIEQIRRAIFEAENESN